MVAEEKDSVADFDGRHQCEYRYDLVLFAHGYHHVGNEICHFQKQSRMQEKGYN